MSLGFRPVGDDLEALLASSTLDDVLVARTAIRRKPCKFACRSSTVTVWIRSARTRSRVSC